MKTCCNCKTKALFYPYICPHCLTKLNDLEIENKLLKRLLNKASQTLKDKGFEKESKTIDLLIND